MLLWTILMIVFLVLMVVSLVLIFILKPYGKHVLNVDKYEISSYETKKDRHGNDIDIYYPTSNFINKYIINHKKNNQHLLIEYLTNEYHYYYVFIYTSKKDKIKFIKDNRNTGYSKIIKLPKDTQSINIFDEKSVISKQKTPKLRLFLLSLLFSVVLTSILVLCKYLFLKFQIDNYYYDYIESTASLISNILLISIPVLFLFILFIILMIKDKRRVL